MQERGRGRGRGRGREEGGACWEGSAVSMAWTHSPRGLFAAIASASACETQPCHTHTAHSDTHSHVRHTYTAMSDTHTQHRQTHTAWTAHASSLEHSSVYVRPMPTGHGVGSA
eukprot:1509274-Rhodomonas_salina.1